MTWGALLASAAVLGALWFLPGWWLLRLLGAGRNVVTLGAGPAATSAMVGILGVSLDRAGLRWGLGWLLGLTAVLAAASWAFRSRRARHAAGPGPAREPGAGLPFTGSGRCPSTGRVGALIAGSVLLAAVLTVGPVAAGMGAPDAPEQAWDAVFHLNAVAIIEQTGNASSLGALGPLYGGSSPYYPTVWHAMAAIAPGLDHLAAAANAQNLVLAALVWPLAMVALTRACTRSDLAVVLVPLVSAAVVAYPVVLLTVVATWPYGLSVAVLPGALALTVRAVQAAPGERLRAAGAALVAGAGVVLAHGSGAFSLVLLAGPLVLPRLWRAARTGWSSGRPRIVVASVVLGLALLGLAAVVAARLPALLTTLNFERLGSPSYLPALGKLLVDLPLVHHYGVHLPGGLAVTALGVVGGALCLRRRRHRWLVVSAVAAALLVLLAAGPDDNPLRTLTGFWYTQPARIGALVAVPAVVLAAVGGAAAVRRLDCRLRSRTPAIHRAAAVTVVGAVLVATAVDRWDLKQRVTESVYRPGHIAWGTMLGAAEIDMVERLRDTLPADALVLGDPFNGSAYLPALAGVDVVFPQLGNVRGDDAAALRSSFDDLRTDPAVCAAARALGVTHVYTDSAGAADGAKVHPRTEALREVDTTDGFTLVDSGGTARLWQLDACAS